MMIPGLAGTPITGYSFPIKIMVQHIISCIKILGQGVKIKEFDWDRVLESPEWKVC